MLKHEIRQRFFLPSFPIKSQKLKSLISRKKTIPQPIQKISYKFCKDLSILSSNNSPSLLSHQNQNNFCEMRSLIMTPIRLTNLQISLPAKTAVMTPKIRPRRLTVTSKRKSAENKGSMSTFANIPAEIITTRCSARINSANPKPIRIRNSEEIILTRSGNFSSALIRTKTLRSRNQKNEYERTKNIESESGSPTAYSPIYTNNFDI